MISVTFSKHMNNPCRTATYKLITLKLKSSI